VERGLKTGCRKEDEKRAGNFRQGEDLWLSSCEGRGSKASHSKKTMPDRGPSRGWPIWLRKREGEETKKVIKNRREKRKGGTEDMRREKTLVGFKGKTLCKVEEKGREISFPSKKKKKKEGDFQKKSD